MRTLLLSILSITLCLGESCFWEQFLKPKYTGSYKFNETKVTYFCIDKRLFVGVGAFPKYQLRPEEAYWPKQMTQVLDTKYPNKELSAVTCSCK